MPSKWRSSGPTLTSLHCSKSKVYKAKACVRNALNYAADTRSITKGDLARLNVLKTRCARCFVNCGFEMNNADLAVGRIEKHLLKICSEGWKDEIDVLWTCFHDVRRRSHDRRYYVRLIFIEKTALRCQKNLEVLHGSWTRKSPETPNLISDRWKTNWKAMC